MSLSLKHSAHSCKFIKTRDLRPSKEKRPSEEGQETPTKFLSHQAGEIIPEGVISWEVIP